MAFNVIHTVAEYDYDSTDPTKVEWAVVAEVEIGNRTSKTTRYDLRRMYEDENGNDRPGKGFTFRDQAELEWVIDSLKIALDTWTAAKAEAEAKAAEPAAKPIRRRKAKAST